MKRNLFLLAAVVIAAIFSGIPMAFLTGAQARADAGAETGGETKDVITLRTGRVIEGRILRETADQIEVLVIFRGMEAPTTFARSEILEIQRDVPVESVADQPTPRPRSDRAAPAAREIPEDAPRVYHLKLEGNFGWDISKTPLEDALNDAVSHDPDVIVIEMNAGSHHEGFEGLWAAENLAPLVDRVIYEDGVRVVFWIERAEFGAAFLPFISPEIYFYDNGRLGGIGDLSFFDTGDRLVNEKMISARLGAAEGYAIRGGYDPVLVRAMAIRDRWLAYRLEGGQPIYMERKPTEEERLPPADGGPGWTILTYNPSEMRRGRGRNEEIEGDPVLNLDADLAFRLGVSKGVANTQDDLIFELRIGRDYHVIEGQANEILQRWRSDIRRAQDDLRRLFSELEEVQGRGRGRDQRQSLGAQRRVLEQIRSVLTRYAEVLDPDGQLRSEIDVRLEEVRMALRALGRDRDRGPQRAPGVRPR